MFETRSIYEPLVKLCKELINEKKALIEENEGLKETLRCIRQDNQELREKLFSKSNDDKLADLEEQLAKKVFLLDDEGTPIKSFTLTEKLVLMGEPEPEEKLEVGKWYDARTFEVEKLKELLPVGTKVAIIPNSYVDEAEVINEKEPNHITNVTKVVEEYDLEKGKKQTVVYADVYKFVSNNWFKIIEE